MKIGNQWKPPTSTAQHSIAQHSTASYLRPRDASGILQLKRSQALDL